MTVLDREIALFEELRPTLEAEHNGDWVVIRDNHIAGFFSSFDAAASEAVQQFGRGPYLIRQVGALPVVIPASVAFALQPR